MNQWREWYEQMKGIDDQPLVLEAEAVKANESV